MKTKMQGVMKVRESLKSTFKDKSIGKLCESINEFSD